MRSGPNGKGLSRKAIMSEIDHSLRRLGVDYVDLYQIHRNDNTTPLEETLEALHDLVKAGKVRYIGASSMHAWELAKALHLQREHGWARFVSMQDHLQPARPRRGTRDAAAVRRRGGGHRGVESLGSGRLARPWDEAKGTERSAEDGFADMLYTPATERSDRAIVDTVGMIAGERGVSHAQIALAWLRTNPVVVAPLVGASKTSHIDDAISSLDVELTSEEIAQLEKPYSPRYDFQGISDDAALQRIMRALPNFTTSDVTQDESSI